MDFLQVRSSELFEPLYAAGGSDAATKGSKKFPAAWVKLAHDDGLSFNQAQRDFIKTTHYDKQVAKFKAGFGIDVDQRSRALENVVWSICEFEEDRTVGCQEEISQEELDAVRMLQPELAATNVPPMARRAHSHELVR